MKLENWLKRKYPKHHKKLEEIFPEYHLELLKQMKYKVGFLLEDNGENKKGDYVIFKRTKEMIPENENGYEYPSPGGWSGAFEYNYVFPKPGEQYSNCSYLKLVEEID